MLEFCSQPNITSKMQMAYFSKDKGSLGLIVSFWFVYQLRKRRYAIMISSANVNLYSKAHTTAKSTIQVRKKVVCDSVTEWDSLSQIAAYSVENELPSLQHRQPWLIYEDTPKPWMSECFKYWVWSQSQGQSFLPDCLDSAFRDTKEMWTGGFPPAKQDLQKTRVPLGFFLLLLFQK